MKKVLVTGATGFVGSHVVRLLADKGMKILAIVRDVSKAEALFSDLPSVRYIACEMEQYQHLPEFIADRDIDIAYHFAWNGSAGPERANTWLQLCNAQYSADLLRALQQIGCPRVVCAGTIMEHEVIAACYTDGNKPGPGYIYGSGKLVSHTMCMSVAAQIGIDLIWAEITNAYGEGEKSSRMVNTTIRKIINHQPLTFTSGTQNYDFVYIDDVAEAFYLIGEKGKPFHDYLIGSSGAKALRLFLEEMQQAIAPEQEFIFGDIPFTGIDLPLERFSGEKTEIETGFRAKICFGDGVQRTQKWLMENE